jgi:hypothetical protein
LRLDGEALTLCSAPVRRSDPENALWRHAPVEPGPIPGSYWIEPDRLLAGPYPAGHVDRLSGIDVVVALTEQDELPPYELQPGVRLVRSADSRVRLPRARGAPREPLLTRAAERHGA